MSLVRKGFWGSKKICGDFLALFNSDRKQIKIVRVYLKTEGFTIPNDFPKAVKFCSHFGS